MPKFEVPVDMHPGMYRAGLGFFPPGSVIELPDPASKPSDLLSSKLIPLDDEGHALLKDHAQKRVLRLAEAKKKKTEAPAVEEVTPVKKPVPVETKKSGPKGIGQAARELMTGSGRESDK